MARKSKNISSGPSKFIIFIGDEGAILVYMRGQTVIRRMYAPSPEDEFTEGFREYLNRDTDARIYLLVDVIDQTYTAQTLPPVTKLSVGKLIKRRLDRDFAPEDIKGAIPLGREAEGRKDWNYLLIALSPTPQLNKWIGLFSELPNRLNGIYLAPVEAEHYIKELSEAITAKNNTEPSRWQFLVSHHKVGGFRQIVTKDGKLLFTRLAQPIGESLPEVIAGNIEQEVLNTIEYLRRLGYTEEHGLDIITIVSEEIKLAIEQNNFAASHVSVLTPYEANELLELNKAALPEDHYGDVIMASFFGTRKKHKLKLHTPYIKQVNQYYLYNSYIKASAGALITALILYTSSLAYNTLPLLAGIEEAEKKEISLNKEISNLNADINTLPADIDRITDVVSVYESYASQEHSPLNYISMFSTAMEGDVLVKSINWNKKNTLTMPNPDKNDSINMEVDVEFNTKTGPVDTLVEIADSFIGRIRTGFSGYEVNHSKLPGTLNEDETFQATFGGNNTSTSSNMLSGEPIAMQINIKGPTDKNESAVK